MILLWAIQYNIYWAKIITKSAYHKRTAKIGSQKTSKCGWKLLFQKWCEKSWSQKNARKDCFFRDLRKMVSSKNYVMRKVLLFKQCSFSSFFCLQCNIYWAKSIAKSAYHKRIQQKWFSKEQQKWRKIIVSKVMRKQLITKNCKERSFFRDLRKNSFLDELRDANIAFVLKSLQVVDWS